MTSSKRAVVHYISDWTQKSGGTFPANKISRPQITHIQRGRLTLCYNQRRMWVCQKGSQQFFNKRSALFQFYVAKHAVKIHNRILSGSSWGSSFQENRKRSRQNLGKRNRKKSLFFICKSNLFQDIFCRHFKSFVRRVRRATWSGWSCSWCPGSSPWVSTAEQRTLSRFSFVISIGQDFP